MWFEEEKTFFNFCTVSTRRLLLHTLPIHPLPLVLHQFTNNLKIQYYFSLLRGRNQMTLADCCLIKKGLRTLRRACQLLGLGAV